MRDVEVLTLADAIAKVENKTFFQCDDRAETLGDTLAKKTCKGRIEVPVYTLAANLLKVKTHTLADQDIGQYGGGGNG